MTADQPANDQPTNDDPADDETTTTLPWWHSPLNLAIVLLGVLVLAGGAGFVIGERNATPDPNSTDIGFLHDMRTHHEQAYSISLTYMSRPDIDQRLELIAQEILVSQAVDAGRMIQLLRDYGKPEANESGVSMAWMGHEVPEERMPGLASIEDLNTLANAPGAAADDLFANLMIVHHEAGIEMAEYASNRAGTTEVREFAAAMASSQQGEIVELRNILASK